jgi:AraC family transcriptional regulator
MASMVPERPCRARLLASPLGLVEHVQSGRDGAARAEGFSSEFQVCLPTRGLFLWHVGAEAVVGDPTHALFVRAGEPYRLTEPIGGGYAELVVTPEIDLLAEAVRTPVARLAGHALFRARRAPVGPAIQRARACLLRAASDRRESQLAQEEALVALLGATCTNEPPRLLPGPSTRRLIQRTKEHLEAHLGSALRLVEVARAVGASPAYLTSIFRRFEGLSLHQYLTQVRLARSLTELAHASDLLTLAIDLGFSSHSHFAGAFRQAFGMSPSEFRDAGRRPPTRRH